MKIIMNSGQTYNDFYEELIHVKRDGLIKNKYIIYERDKEKGCRISHVDSASGAVYREDKWNPNSSTRPSTS